MGLTGIEMTRFLLSLLTLLVAANVLGYLAERLTVPRVIGEVAGGLVLGPTVFGHFAPGTFQWLYQGFPAQGKLLGLVYQLGLIFLMFHSGLKFQPKFNRGDTSIGLAILVGSTVIPFAAGWMFTGFMSPVHLLGPAQSLVAFKIVVAISIAVTSIPVISKILFDLGVMHTRFAKLVVAVAGIHDALLWVGLALAAGLAGAESQPGIATALRSTGATFGLIAVCLLVLPRVLRRINGNRFNILVRASFLGYILAILLMLALLAGYLGVDVMFGALLAGIAVKLAFPEHLFDRVENSIREISFSFFIPLYFAMVGLQIDLARQFPLGFFLLYLLFATAVQGSVVYLTCRFLHLDRLTSMNLAAAMNARGGPGIVLSTVAFSLGLISEPFFAVLVMLALVTSWMAGSWLRFVVKTGRPLMPGDEKVAVVKPQEEVTLDAVPSAK